ncbi:CinA family protein [Deltaproteobacteria bacterium OttesenSCG-928-M10]|nr:CinA family protein [Deltaproteobacteria bacterium OttesenSCG-928-M10]
MIEDTVRALFDKLSAGPVRTGCAESLTGGRVAAALTSLPGSSAFFQGGVVAYSNQLKVELLGVPMEVILNHGAVSRECALAMAEGVRRKLGLAAAVATTGIAGPDGGGPDKPVGLVWLAAATGKGAVARREVFSGDREAVTEASVQAALKLLLAAL